MTESYRIIVYAVENNLIYPQLDSSILNDDYRHDHVVRQLVSENYLGDPTGSLIAGGSTIKTYTLSLNENWKKEDLKVYALVVAESTGFIHNMAFCDVNGGYMNSEE